MLEAYRDEKNNRIQWIDVLVLIFLAFSLSGITSDLYMYISLALCALTMLALLIQSGFKVTISDRRILCAGFVVLYMTVVGYPVGGIVFALKKALEAAIHFSMIILFLYYKDKRGTRSYSFVLTGLLIITFIYMLNAYNAYTSLDVNARRIADHTGDYGVIAIGGGYGFAYALSLLGVFLFDALRNGRIQKQSRKILAAVMIVFIALVVYETLSTITLVAFVFGLLVSLIILPVRKDPLRGSNAAQVVLFTILVFVILVLLLPVIGNLLISISAGNTTVLGDRLQSLGNMLAGAGDGDYAEGRLSIPLKSINTFLKNPLIGVAHQHGNGFYRPKYFGVGNHSEWVDALANFGLIGGIPYLYIYFKTLKDDYTGSDQLGLGLAATFLLMGTFNPFRTMQSSIIFFLLIPLLIGAINPKQEKAVNV